MTSDSGSAEEVRGKERPSMEPALKAKTNCAMIDVEHGTILVSKAGITFLQVVANRVLPQDDLAQHQNAKLVADPTGVNNHFLRFGKN